MNVLVTGGAGFIGSHLCEALQKQGYNVVIIDNLSTGKKENITSCNKNFYKLDICQNLDKIFELYKFGAIFHFAAKTNLRESIKYPLKNAQTNIMGSLNILQYAVKYGIPKFIFASTSGAMYGECLLSGNNKSATELSIPKPNSPYGASKLSFENYLGVYGRQYGIEPFIFRYSNVYGPRQEPNNESGVISIFIDALLNGKKCRIYGDGTQTRDFVYVNDVIETTLLSLDPNFNTIPSLSINICSGKSTTINFVYKLISIALGKSEQPIYELPKPGEIHIVNVNSHIKEIQSLMKKFTPLPKGLEKTINYFQNK